MVLALIGTVILGTALSIDETTTTGTGYRDVADITGLVSTTSDPYFTDYNPSFNWTRYYTSGTNPIYVSGITYSSMPSGQSNNYPVYSGTPVSTSGSFNLDGLTGTGLIGSGWSELRIYRSDSSYNSGTGYTLNPNITTLEIIANAIKTNTTTTITIDGGSGSYNPSRAYISENTPGYTAYYPDRGSKVEYGTSLFWGVGVSRSTYYVSNTWTIDLSTMKATCGNSSTEYNAGEVYVAWGGSVEQNGGSGYNVIPGTITYTRTDSVMNYMDVSEGVTLSNYGSNTSVVWSNGYYNNTIDMVLKGSNGDNLGFLLDRYTWDGSSWTDSTDNEIWINWNATTTTVSIDSQTAVNVGKWNNIFLHIDMGLGEVTVSPITSIPSYTQYTTAQSISVGSIGTGAIDDITFYDGRTNSPTATAPEMMITNTSVWMNTYGAVFRNANLDPSLNFPDYPAYSVKFGSLALIGDSLTINNQALTVTGNNVSYNGKEYPLKGASIVYDGNVYLNGEKDGKDYSLDLGQLTSNNIYFSGTWYVPLTFQEVYQTTVNEYEWVPYSFGLDYNAGVMVFIGLIVGVMFIAPLMKVKPKTLDWVIVVFAGVIGAGLLVV